MFSYGSRLCFQVGLYSVGHIKYWTTFLFQNDGLLLLIEGKTLTVMVLSQHRVSSSKTVRPVTPLGARCMEHVGITWSAVCSVAPHSQFGEGARSQLYVDV